MDRIDLIILGLALVALRIVAMATIDLFHEGARALNGGRGVVLVIAIGYLGFLVYKFVVRLLELPSG